MRKKVLLVQDEINGMFVALLDTIEPTKKQLKTWVEDSLDWLLADRDIEFHEGGSIEITFDDGIKIQISGDNGSVDLETFIVDLLELKK
jgi:hypothetical protein